MAMTIEEIKAQLVERCDPDVLIGVLDLDGDDMEGLVDALHDFILQAEEKVMVFLEETDL